MKQDLLSRSVWGYRTTSLAADGFTPAFVEASNKAAFPMFTTPWGRHALRWILPSPYPMVKLVTRREREEKSPKMSFTVCCLETTHKPATCYKVPNWWSAFKNLPDDTRRKPAAAQVMAECPQELFFTLSFLYLINTQQTGKVCKPSVTYDLDLCTSEFQGALSVLKYPLLLAELRAATG